MTCKHLSATERDSKIMKILEQFELTHSAHVAIGTPGIFSDFKKSSKIPVENFSRKFQIVDNSEIVKINKAFKRH